MRVMLAVHGLPPRAVAGTEVYTLRLGRALQEAGAEVLVLAAAHDLGSAPGTVRRRAEEGVSVAELTTARDGGLASSYDDPRLAGPIAGLIRAFRPDVVHVQHLIGLSVAVLEEARRAGARVLMTLHDHWLSCPRDGLRMREDGTVCAVVDRAACARCLAGGAEAPAAPVRAALRVARAVGAGGILHGVRRGAPRVAAGLLRAGRALASSDGLAEALTARDARLRAAVEAVDVFVAPTRFVAERAVEWGVPRARVVVTGYGAVASGTPPPRPARGRRVGYMGGIAAHKGVHVLLEAFAQVPAPEATLTLHGSLDVHPAYAALIRDAARRDPRVRLAGPFAEGRQREVLDGLDVLAVPSLWWENSPLVVLEARAAGVPVVASRVGGLPEIVPAGAGVLVPPGDPVALAGALADVLASRAPEAAPPPPPKTLGDGAREMLALYAGAA